MTTPQEPADALRAALIADLVSDLRGLGAPDKGLSYTAGRFAQSAQIAVYEAAS